MKLNILIIGKNSFLGSNLSIFLKKKKIKFKKIDLIKFLKLKNSYLSKFNFIVNTAINGDYIKRRYNQKKDFDLLVCKKIKNIKTKLIIFSTGKIYRSGNNIKENSKKKPSGHYGKNKLITENKILKIRKNVLILRLSNIVGKKKINNYRKITNLFFDDIRKNLKKNIIIIPSANYYKDFLLAEDFVKIVYKSMLKNISGVFNLSTNQKIYIKDLAKWISKKTGATILYSNEKTDSFTLNNNKLLNKLKMDKKLLNLKKNIIRII